MEHEECGDSTEVERDHHQGGDPDDGLREGAIATEDPLGAHLLIGLPGCLLCAAGVGNSCVMGVGADVCDRSASLTDFFPRDERQGCGVRGSATRRGHCGIGRCAKFFCEYPADSIASSSRAGVFCCRLIEAVFVFSGHDWALRQRSPGDDRGHEDVGRSRGCGRRLLANT